MKSQFKISILSLLFALISASFAYSQSDGEYFSVTKALQEPTKVTYLDLSGKRYTVLDARLTECVNLEELVLDGMRMEKIPGWIKSFAKLTDLSLSNNKLTKIPGWLKKMESLESVDIRGNDIPDAELANIRHRFDEIDFLTD